MFETESPSTADRLQEILDQHAGDLRGASDTLQGLAAAVASNEDAARFASVVTHVIGEEAGDWNLANHLLGMLQESFHHSVGVQGNFAITCYLDEQWIEGLRAETRAATAGKESALSVAVWIRISTAHAFQRKGSWNKCFRLVEPVLELARGLETPSRHDAATASVANNLASDILDMPARTQEHDIVLEKSALLSRAFWQRAGTWMHQERADYLLAMAYNALGRHEEARQAANRAIATLDSHGDEPVDRAFINVELAVALRQLGRKGDFASARQRAESIAQSFDDPGLRQWFDSRFARIA